MNLPLSPLSRRRFPSRRVWRPDVGLHPLRRPWTRPQTRSLLRFSLFVAHLVRGDALGPSCLRASPVPTLFASVRSVLVPRVDLGRVVVGGAFYLLNLFGLPWQVSMDLSHLLLGRVLLFFFLFLGLCVVFTFSLVVHYFATVTHLPLLLNCNCVTRTKFSAKLLPSTTFPSFLLFCLKVLFPPSIF